MKITIVQSDGVIQRSERPFAVRFDNTYAERFVQHIKDDPKLCTGCGDKCRRCRKSYEIGFEKDISQIVKIPSELPFYVNEPQDVLPKNLKTHDALVAINIHEEVLLYLPKLAKKAGCRAIIVPQEDPEWLTKWAIDELANQCSDLEMETVFPKPFCELEPDESHPVINEFIDYFRVGKPKLRLKVKNKRVEEAEVLRSAPCGDTYYVAYNILNKKVDDKFDWWASKYWHSFPCVASMKMDPDIGDTILHKGGYILLDTVHEATRNL